MLAIAKDVQNRLETQEHRLEEGMIKLDEGLRMTLLNNLILRSEAGDRFAYGELFGKLYGDIATNQSDEVRFMLQKLFQIERMYTGEPDDNPVLKNSFFGPPLEPKSISASLSSSTRDTRIWAVYSVKALRENSYIQTLAELAEKEPDLNVLQAILYTLNVTFVDNYTFNKGSRNTIMLHDCFPPHQIFRKRFDELWSDYGDLILKRKPKKFAQIPDPQHPHMTLHMIVDPEQEEEDKK